MVRLRSPQVPQKGFSSILVIVIVILIFSVGVFLLFKPTSQENIMQTQLQAHIMQIA